LDKLEQMHHGKAEEQKEQLKEIQEQEVEETRWKAPQVISEQDSG